MAFREVTSDGTVLIVPASSISITVSAQPTGLSTSGVIAIVGEANEGPAWNSPGESLAINTYGVGDLSKVQAKFGSGRLVDAFSNMLVPSASPKVAGGPTNIIVVKTNNSTQAASTFQDGSGSIKAIAGGTAGNLINYQITEAVPEVAPTTGQFSYIPNASGSSAWIRVNGGSRQVLPISALTAPNALAAEISSLSNLNAVGGIDRLPLAGLTGQNISVIASGSNINIALVAGQVFSAQPQVGDTLSIPTGSVIAGAGNANVGFYLVTAIVNSTALAQITAQKIPAGSPVNVSPVAISATPSNDLNDYSAIQINDMSGTNRNILTGLVGQSIAIAASGSNITATLASGQVFAANPQIGDLLYIPGGSAYEGSGNANVGWYKISSSINNLTSAMFTASRLSNGNPVAVASTPIVAITDLQDSDPQIRGSGKALEIYDAGGAVNISALFLQLGTVNPAPWISSPSSPLLLDSSAELEDGINIVQSSTNSSEQYEVGGNIVLEVGYRPSVGSGTATLSIAKISGSLTLTTSVSGGPGSNLTINLSNVPTINDLVNIINSNPGYSASAFSSASGLRQVIVLDNVTSIGISSENGAQPGRIKSDQYDLSQGSSGLSTSQLIDYTSISTAGLPDAQNVTFLSGGLLGGTSGTQFANAINGLSSVQCNFVVPLVSQDASKDKVIGQTDPSSSYQIASVNATLKQHCLAMSTPKIKRNRIGLASIEDTFVNQQSAAQSMANFRIAMTFEDMIQPSISAGQNVQFQPWMSAVLAASFQAAAFSKTIFNKAVDCVGIAQAAGDYNPGDLSDQETALDAGLLPLATQSNGQVNFISDQTTYSTDQNFVYNSLQAVYTADIIALDLAQSLQSAFVGEVTADVSETGVASFIKAKFRQYLNLKLTAGTSKNPTGWISINVQINVPVMTVQVVCIESTGIYFIPINLTIQGVNSSN